MIIGNIAKISKIIKTDEWEMYFENPTDDYFNIQKEKIKLIISLKKGAVLRHTPDHYGPPGSIGYALIRGYNCLGRCHYCYLQSYFKSPDIVKFSNTDFIVSFVKKFLDKFFSLDKNKDKLVIFYDGDFQDSLGYTFLKENISQLVKILDLLKNYRNVKLEIRTKQVLVDYFENLYSNLFKKEYIDTLIVAITFSPEEVIKNFEIGTSDLNDRITFAKFVQDRGFKIGIRIDPIVFFEKDFEKNWLKYKKLIEKLFLNLNDKLIYNWGIGTLRLKKSLYKRLKKTGSLLVNNLIFDKGFYRYPLERRKEIYKRFSELVGGRNFYVCMDGVSKDNRR